MEALHGRSVCSSKRQLEQEENMIVDDDILPIPNGPPLSNCVTLPIKPWITMDPWGHSNNIMNIITKNIQTIAHGRV